jgi:hypothetical protein
MQLGPTCLSSVEMRATRAGAYPVGSCSSDAWRGELEQHLDVCARGQRHDAGGEPPDAAGHRGE